MNRSHQTTVLAAVASTLVGVVAVLATLMITTRSDSPSTTKAIEGASPTTVASIEDAKRDWVEVASALARDPRKQVVSEITTIDGIPTAASAPKYEGGSWTGDYPVRVWEYRDGRWARTFESSGGRPVSAIRFLDLTKDGVSEILFDGLTTMSTETIVATRGVNGWRFVPFLPSNELSNGKIDVDQSSRMATDAMVCDGPGCGGALKNYWHFDTTTGSFVRD